LDWGTIGGLEAGEIVAPFLHLPLDVLEEAAVPLGFEERQQRRQGGGRVADKGNLGGDAVAGPGGIDLDLHHPGLLGQEGGVGVVGAHHEQHVARLHRQAGRTCAEQAEAAARERVIVGHRRLARQGL